MSHTASRTSGAEGYVFPPPLGSSCLSPARSGLPGSSADLFSHAASNHPGRSDECAHPLLPHRCQASPLSGGLATFHCLTGPNQVRLRYGLRVRPSKASPEGLHPLALAGLLVERVIYKVNSFQFTRSTRLVLALPRNAKNAYVCYPLVNNTGWRFLLTLLLFFATVSVSAWRSASLTPGN